MFTEDPPEADWSGWKQSVASSGKQSMPVSGRHQSMSASGKRQSMAPNAFGSQQAIAVANLGSQQALQFQQSSPTVGKHGLQQSFPIMGSGGKSHVSEHVAGKSQSAQKSPTGSGSSRKGSSGSPKPANAGTGSAGMIRRAANDSSVAIGSQGGTGIRHGTSGSVTSGSPKNSAHSRKLALLQTDDSITGGGNTAVVENASGVEHRRPLTAPASTKGTMLGKGFGGALAAARFKKLLKNKTSEAADRGLQHPAVSGAMSGGPPRSAPGSKSSNARKTKPKLKDQAEVERNVSFEMMSDDEKNKEDGCRDGIEGMVGAFKSKSMKIGNASEDSEDKESSEDSIFNMMGQTNDVVDHQGVPQDDGDSNLTTPQGKDKETGILFDMSPFFAHINEHLRIDEHVSASAQSEIEAVDFDIQAVGKEKSDRKTSSKKLLRKQVTTDSLLKKDKKPFQLTEYKFPLKKAKQRAAELVMQSSAGKRTSSNGGEGSRPGSRAGSATPSRVGMTRAGVQGRVLVVQGDCMGLSKSPPKANMKSYLNSGIATVDEKLITNPMVWMTTEKKAVFTNVALSNVIKMPDVNTLTLQTGESVEGIPTRNSVDDGSKFGIATRGSTQSLNNQNLTNQSLNSASAPSIDESNDSMLDCTVTGGASRGIISNMVAAEIASSRTSGVAASTKMGSSMKMSSTKISGSIKHEKKAAKFAFDVQEPTQEGQGGFTTLSTQQAAGRVSVHPGSGGARVAATGRGSVSPKGQQSGGSGGAGRETEIDGGRQRKSMMPSDTPSRKSRKSIGAVLGMGKVDIARSSLLGTNEAGAASKSSGPIRSLVLEETAAMRAESGVMSAKLSPSVKLMAHVGGSSPLTGSPRDGSRDGSPRTPRKKEDETSRTSPGDTVDQGHPHHGHPHDHHDHDDPHHHHRHYAGINGLLWDHGETHEHYEQHDEKYAEKVGYHAKLITNPYYVPGFKMRSTPGSSPQKKKDGVFCPANTGLRLQDCTPERDREAHEKVFAVGRFAVNKQNKKEDKSLFLIGCDPRGSRPIANELGCRAVGKNAKQAEKDEKDAKVKEGENSPHMLKQKLYMQWQEFLSEVLKAEKERKQRVRWKANMAEIESNRVGELDIKVFFKEIFSALKPMLKRDPYFVSQYFFAQTLAGGVSYCPRKTEVELFKKFNEIVEERRKEFLATQDTRTANKFPIDGAGTSNIVDTHGDANFDSSSNNKPSPNISGSGNEDDHKALTPSQKEFAIKHPYGYGKGMGTGKNQFGLSNDGLGMGANPHLSFDPVTGKKMNVITGEIIQDGYESYFEKAFPDFMNRLRPFEDDSLYQNRFFKHQKSLQKAVAVSGGTHVCAMLGLAQSYEAEGNNERARAEYGKIVKRAREGCEVAQTCLIDVAEFREKELKENLINRLGLMLSSPTRKEKAEEALSKFGGIAGVQNLLMTPRDKPVGSGTANLCVVLSAVKPTIGAGSVNPSPRATPRSGGIPRLGAFPGTGSPKSGSPKSGGAGIGGLLLTPRRAAEQEAAGAFETPSRQASKQASSGGVEGMGVMGVMGGSTNVKALLSPSGSGVGGAGATTLGGLAGKFAKKMLAKSFNEEELKQKLSDMTHTMASCLLRIIENHPLDRHRHHLKEKVKHGLRGGCSSAKKETSRDSVHTGTNKSCNKSVASASNAIKNPHVQQAGMLDKKHVGNKEGYDFSSDMHAQKEKAHVTANQINYSINLDQEFKSVPPITSRNITSLVQSKSSSRTVPSKNEVIDWVPLERSGTGLVTGRRLYEAAYVENITKEYDPKFADRISVNEYTGELIWHDKGLIHQFGKVKKNIAEKILLGAAHGTKLQQKIHLIGKTKQELQRRADMQSQNTVSGNEPDRAGSKQTGGHGGSPPKNRSPSPKTRTSEGHGHGSPGHGHGTRKSIPILGASRKSIAQRGKNAGIHSAHDDQKGSAKDDPNKPINFRMDGALVHRVHDESQKRFSNEDVFTALAVGDNATEIVDLAAANRSLTKQKRRERPDPYRQIFLKKEDVLDKGRLNATPSLKEYKKLEQGNVVVPKKTFYHGGLQNGGSTAPNGDSSSTSNGNGGNATNGNGSSSGNQSRKPLDSDVHTDKALVDNYVASEGFDVMKYINGQKSTEFTRGLEAASMLHRKKHGVNQFDAARQAKEEAEEAEYSKKLIQGGVSDEMKMKLEREKQRKQDEKDRLRSLQDKNSTDYRETVFASGRVDQRGRPVLCTRPSSSAAVGSLKSGKLEYSVGSLARGERMVYSMESAESLYYSGKFDQNQSGNYSNYSIGSGLQWGQSSDMLGDSGLSAPQNSMRRFDSLKSQHINLGNATSRPGSAAGESVEGRPGSADSGSRPQSATSRRQDGTPGGRRGSQTPTGTSRSGPGSRGAGSRPGTGSVFAQSKSNIKAGIDLVNRMRKRLVAVESKDAAEGDREVGLNPAFTYTSSATESDTVPGGFGIRDSPSDPHFIPSSSSGPNLIRSSSSGSGPNHDIIPKIKSSPNMGSAAPSATAAKQLEMQKTISTKNAGQSPTSASSAPSMAIPHALSVQEGAIDKADGMMSPQSRLSPKIYLQSPRTAEERVAHQVPSLAMDITLLAGAPAAGNKAGNSKLGASSLTVTTSPRTGGLAVSPRIGGQRSISPRGSVLVSGDKLGRLLKESAGRIEPKITQRAAGGQNYFENTTAVAGKSRGILGSTALAGVQAPTQAAGGQAGSVGKDGATIAVGKDEKVRGEGGKNTGRSGKNLIGKSRTERRKNKNFKGEKPYDVMEDSDHEENSKDRRTVRRDDDDTRSENSSKDRDDKLADRLSDRLSDSKQGSEIDSKDGNSEDGRDRRGVSTGQKFWDKRRKRETRIQKENDDKKGYDNLDELDVVRMFKHAPSSDPRRVKRSYSLWPTVTPMPFDDATMIRANCPQDKERDATGISGSGANTRIFKHRVSISQIKPSDARVTDNKRFITIKDIKRGVVGSGDKEGGDRDTTGGGGFGAKGAFKKAGGTQDLAVAIEESYNPEIESKAEEYASKIREAERKEEIQKKLQKGEFQRKK